MQVTSFVGLDRNSLITFWKYYKFMDKYEILRASYQDNDCNLYPNAEMLMPFPPTHNSSTCLPTHNPIASGLKLYEHVY